MRYIVIFIYMTLNGHGRILFCYFFATTITGVKEKKFRELSVPKVKAIVTVRLSEGAVIDKLNSF